jgi:hypothetical protein
MWQDLEVNATCLNQKALTPNEADVNRRIGNWWHEH